MNLLCALSVFLLAIIPVYTNEGDVTLDEGVLVLTQDNFEKVINSNDFVLVEFYAPWCGHCKALAPEYVKAAKALVDKGSQIKLAKVDATEESSLAEKFEIRGYPTLKFFKKGNPFEYNETDDLSAETIKNFVQSFLDNKIKPHLLSQDLPDDWNKEGVYTLVASNFESVALDPAKDVLVEFYAPWCGHCKQLAPIYDKVEYIKTGLKISQKNPQIKLAKIDVSIYSNIAETYTIQGLPSMKFFKKGIILDYKDICVFTSECIQNFVEKVLNNELEPYMKSEDLPDDWDKKPVYTLVGSNFDSVAYDTTKDVLIDFYAPWCGYCKRLEPIYEEVGKSFLNDSNVVIGKIDLTANEVRNITIKSYPTIILFRKIDNKVIVFSKERSVLNLTNFILSGDTPWCTYCKLLTPEYIKAAKELADKESPIKLGKVNCTQEVNIAQHFQIKGFPTILFFKKGHIINYTGARTSKYIVLWLEKKSGDPVKLITTLNDAQKVIEDNDVVIIGFFTDKSSNQITIYSNVSDTFDTFLFAMITDENIFKEFGATDGSVTLFKKFDEKKSIFDKEFTANNLRMFVHLESRPLLNELTPATDQEFLGKPSSNLFVLYAIPNHNRTNEISQVLRSVARGFRPKVWFVIVDVTKQDRDKIISFVKLKPKQVPMTILLEIRNNEITKYKEISQNFTASAIQTFVQNYLDNKLKPYVMSQDLPNDWNASTVLTLVADNFKEVVFDTTKHVFVEFYAPWCTFCKVLEPTFKELSTSFDERNDIIFAKIDVDENELNVNGVLGLPTLILFKKNDKNGVKYEGPRTLEIMKSFINKHCRKGIFLEDSDER
ncbi:hypothetical protein FQR65_LT08283 [Abscondita terminalis]|nr:hypothetical protein FQR65_LT08283 [Abscondita terminalis]